MFNFLKKVEGKVINVNEIDNLLEINLIDIREPYEYKGGSIRNSKNVPMQNLITNPDKYLIKDKTYYIICQSGGRSARTVNHLKKQGYDVVNVIGGIGSYVGTKRK
jgi:rhodanese-related sulfurtransferase